MLFLSSSSCKSTFGYVSTKMKKLAVCVVAFSLIAAPFASAQAPSALDGILADIQTLEGNSDPKCYATASRLEDFMYGTPLTDEARFQKNRLQKRLAGLVWRRAGEGAGTVSAGQIDAAFNDFVSFSQAAGGAHTLGFPSSAEITISATDLRQYGSIAYSLRAILAVQQDSIMMPGETPLPPLSAEAREVLKRKMDLATLALLQEADAYARAHDRYEIDLANINRAWLALFQLNESEAAPVVAEVRLSEVKPPLMDQIIQQKVSSYEKYNQVSNQLFVRNMQVYFARLSWPQDKEEAEVFRDGFIEALVGYAIEMYKGTVEVAVSNGQPVIQEAHVAHFVQHFTPYTVNEYEDVTYFPRLPGREVTMEAYDLDAFRDSGVHWVYLGEALDSPEIEGYLDVDPFAAELMAENVAQFGVLLLREAGLEGAKTGQERLSLELLATAMQTIQQKINDTVAGRSVSGAKAAELVSRDDPENAAGNASAWFTDVTAESGAQSMHRTSSWLNRLMRSYLQKDDNTGIITIPPAFGGSGVAVGDIDNDGLDDILILSGLGNRLFMNEGGGRFSDATEASGLVFTRHEDNRPGEPRQPIIADLDNDGLQDIVITYVDDDHRVYRNLGDEKFQDMTEKAALGGKGLVGGPATVFDYDNDGLLDIYVAYFGDYIHGVLPTLSRYNENGLPNKLFRNMGGFEFKEVDAGVSDTGWGQALTHTDFNTDNLQDLIVGNDFGTNTYYQNLGNGKFRDVSAELGVDKPSYTMNISLADLNADRIPDVYISNIVTMNKDEKYVLPNADTQMKFNLEKLANLRVVDANDLFISEKPAQGEIRYQLNRELVGRGYNSTGWSWGAGFFDADNDGDDDLYVLNGMNEFNIYSSQNTYAEPGTEAKTNQYMPVDTKESNVFFVNSGGKLNNASERSGLDLLGNSRSAAYFDYDDDGDLDIILNNYHQSSNLYRNNADRLGTHWIKLKLQGDPEQAVNRDAIGARVLFTLPDGSTIWREVHGSGAYLTVQSKTIHAGLGKMDRVDVEVTWPGGRTQVVKNLEANQTHTIEMVNATGQ